MKIQRFEDLECWQQARVLVNMVYDTIKASLSFQKDFRLVNQITGAAISSMANIAEGFIRRSDKEFIQFLFIAMSSAAEVQSHLYVALDQNYIDHKQFDKIYEQARKTAMLISGFIKYLRRSDPRASKKLQNTKHNQKTEQTK